MRPRDGRPVEPLRQVSAVPAFWRQDGMGMREDMTARSDPADRERQVGDGVRVDVTIPADPARLPLLHSVAAALAVSQDLDLDTMIDLRLAMDAFSAKLIPCTRTREGGSLVCRFISDGDELTVAANPRRPAGATIDCDAPWEQMSLRLRAAPL